MFRNMVTSLFKYDRIRTTDAKAKELRKWADDLITLAKRGDLHARRQAMAIIREKNVVHKLFENAGERFGQRQGGYTRIIKLGKRPGDAANVSLIELVTTEPAEKKKKTAPAKTVTESAAPVVEEASAEAATDKAPADGVTAEAAEAETETAEDPADAPDETKEPAEEEEAEKKADKE